MYAWQSQEGGSGIMADIGLSYGFTPVVEAGFQVGTASGRYRVNVLSKTKGNLAAPPKENEFANSNIYFGPTVLAAFAPGASFRPVLGGSVLYWKGEGVDSNEQLPPELETFAAPVLWVLQAKGGAELRMSKALDFFVHVPVTAVVGGTDTAFAHTGRGCREDVEGGGSQRCLDTDSNKPPGVTLVGAGVMLGLQVRLF